MPSGDKFVDLLKQEGGCGLLIMALGGAMFLAFLYLLLTGGFGNPEAAKFEKACHDRESAKYLPGDVPDYAIHQIVMQCEKELRAHLGLPE